MGHSHPIVAADCSLQNPPFEVTQPPSDLAVALSAVDSNAVVAGRLTDIVERRLTAGRDESVLAWARVVAAFEITNPTGHLRNARVETALDVVARRALRDAGDRRHLTDPRTVLHVLSESHMIGGHVRMAGRWASLDRRQSRFVITRPGCDGAALRRVAAEQGAGVDVLTGPSLLGRAAQLRGLAADADVVVCHTHGDDPVPSVAFGGDYSGAPVVMVNHADHLFWLGTGNISTIAQLRRTGADATDLARGFHRPSFMPLPIPMEVVTRRCDRRAAKEALGLDPSRVVALTLARPTKYARSDFHPGFLEVVEPVFAESDAMLLAVGPSMDDPEWAAAADRLGDKARVLGLQPDPNPYLDAADVYLDSFPFCSNTSILEAAARGLPIVTSRQHSGLQRLHGSEGVLDGALIGPTTMPEYREVLAELLVDPIERNRSGQLAFDTMRAEHSPDAWRAQLEDVYRHAMVADPVCERIQPYGAIDQELREYAVVLQGIESANPLMWTLKTTLEAFDRADRVSLQGRMFAARALLRARRLVPVGADLAWLMLPSRWGQRRKYGTRMTEGVAR
jgi:hypothetical protein